MGKLITIALMVFAICFAGCSEENRIATFTERKIYATAERPCFCIVAKEDIGKMLEAAHRKDVEYLDGMLEDGRAFSVKEVTKVSCSDVEERRGIVLVKVLEGEHENKWGYTFSKRVR